MKRSILNFAILFVVVSLVFTSCSKDSVGQGGNEGTEQGSGEGVEGPENGSESGSEQGESGTRWGVNEVADEVINGIHAIISYNASTNAFEGTFENTNSNVAQQTRLEVHLFEANGNSTEYGPTPGVDMASGEIRNVTLSIPSGTSFVEFTMHPEVGTAGSGG